ncbi:uncharacterized protein [Dermacentor albipictus]|uniref:uncharacterized protein isoform X2 n=1 Tax=Dermacentor albipictus TaxID=60249 RepID=UPI0038FCF889
MADTPQAALKEAKRQSNLSVNPKYTVTWHGFLNIAEIVTAIAALVAVMLSSNETLAAELMVVSSFAYGYVSLIMLAGGIVSPYTQALLPLSLYRLPLAQRRLAHGRRQGRVPHASRGGLRNWLRDNALCARPVHLRDGFPPARVNGTIA